MNGLEVDLVQSLLGASLVAVTLAFCAMMIPHRRYFFLGIATAYVAFFVVTLFFGAFRYLHVEQQFFHVLILIVGPSVEELLRVVVVFAFFSNVESHNRLTWLLFSLGYASLESVLKFTDLLPLLSQQDEFAASVAVVTSPLIPLALHANLSLIVLSLHSKNLPFFGVFFSALLLHGLHNLSVAAAPTPVTWHALLANNLVRVGLLAFIFALLIRGWRKSQDQRHS